MKLIQPYLIQPAVHQRLICKNLNLVDKRPNYRSTPNNRRSRWRNCWRIGVVSWRHRTRWTSWSPLHSDLGSHLARPTWCAQVPVTSRVPNIPITWRHPDIRWNDCLAAAAPNRPVYLNSNGRVTMTTESCINTVCITTNQPDTKSNPNRNPNATTILLLYFRLSLYMFYMHVLPCGVRNNKWMDDKQHAIVGIQLDIVTSQRIQKNSHKTMLFYSVTVTLSR